MRDKKKTAKRGRLQARAAEEKGVLADESTDNDVPGKDDRKVVDFFTSLLEDDGPSARVVSARKAMHLALKVVPLTAWQSVGAPLFDRDAITQPAVLFQGHVYTKAGSRRHVDVLADMYAIFKGHLEGESEGYLTASGQYATQFEAKEIVRDLQQGTVRTVNDYRLLAEELWP